MYQLSSTYEQLKTSLGWQKQGLRYFGSFRKDGKVCEWMDWLTELGKRRTERVKISNFHEKLLYQPTSHHHQMCRVVSWNHSLDRYLAIFVCSSSTINEKWFSYIFPLSMLIIVYYYFAWGKFWEETNWTWILYSADPEAFVCMWFFLFHFHSHQFIFTKITTGLHFDFISFSRLLPSFTYCWSECAWERNYVFFVCFALMATFLYLLKKNFNELFLVKTFNSKKHFPQINRYFHSTSANYSSF